MKDLKQFFERRKNLLSSLFLSTLILLGCPNKQSQESKTYAGRIQGYSFCVETNVNEKYLKYALRAEIQSDSTVTQPYSIVGFDYNGDNLFDKVFIQKTITSEPLEISSSSQEEIGLTKKLLENVLDNLK
jgi:hypothetical protein